MKLNQELRSPSMVKRFNLTIISAYILLVGGVFALASYVYFGHSGIQLPDGYINLKMSKERYQPGDVVSFSVTNNFPATVFVTNNCPGEPFDVFKWQNNSWARIHDKVSNLDSLCYKQPRNVPIPANGTITYNFSDWKNLFASPGIYRIAMVVDHYKQIPYQDFAVLEPAPTITTPTITPQQSAPLEPYEAPNDIRPKVINNNYQENDEEDDD